MRHDAVSKGTIQAALKSYQIDAQEITPLAEGIENYNYHVRTPDHQYVLRVYRDGRPRDIKYELDVMRHFQNAHIQIPQVFASGRGMLYARTNGKYCALFDFAEGDSIPWKPIPQQLSVNIGRTVAALHLAGIAYPSSRKQVRYFHQTLREMSCHVKNQSLCRMRDALLDDLEGLLAMNIPAGVIHSDINRENILVANKRISAILDFNEAHHDYIVWDTAIAITQLYITKTFGIDWRGLASFAEGYSAIRRLSLSEINSILPLMKLRNIQVALHVSNMQRCEGGDLRQLRSIEKSVLHKIDLIDNNAARLQQILSSLQ